MEKTMRNLLHAFWLICMLVISMVMLYPFLFSLLAGLNTKTEFGHMGTLFPIPAEPVYANFLYMFTPTGIRPLINTILRTSWYTVIVCIMAILVGYVMARYSFKGKQFFLLVIVAAQLIPSVLTLIPSFVMISKIPFVGGNNWMGSGGKGLINDPLSLYLPLNWVYLIWVFLFTQSMKMLPRDFEEAAELDGCGFWRTIFTIVVPLQLPMLAVIAVNVALQVWNDWLTPFLYINNMQDSTLPAYLGMLTAQLQNLGEKDYPKLFAMSTVAIVPPFLIFLFLQKYIIQGISSAGVKG